jgi:amino-acid N-acetyltransferase
MQAHRSGSPAQRMNDTRLGALRTEIHSASSQDLQSIRGLLDLAALPSAEVAEESLRDFLVCRIDMGVIAAVGLGRYGDTGLLRSLVVAKAHLGSGIGKQLVDAAEKRASAIDVQSIYLLTTAADAFFEKLGFRRLQRELAPAAIRSSYQFASLCPASAVLMVKP